MVDELKRGVPCALTADLAANDNSLTAEQIRERLSGNLCRCGAYNGIVAAISETYAANTVP